MKRLTNDDLAKICGGQYVYCVFDKNKKEIKYYIPRENDILMTYNGTAVKEMCGNKHNSVKPAMKLNFMLGAS